jgi:hypothetical protein
MRSFVEFLKRDFFVQAKPAQNTETLVQIEPGLSSSNEKPAQVQAQQSVVEEKAAKKGTKKGTKKDPTPEASVIEF